MSIDISLTFSYRQSVEFFISINFKNGLMWNMNFYGKNVNPIMKIEKLLHTYNICKNEELLQKQHRIQKTTTRKKDVRLVVELKSWQSNTGRWRGSQKDLENKMGRENETRKDNVFSRMD